MEIDRDTGMLTSSVESRMALCTTEQKELCNLLRMGFYDWVHHMARMRLPTNESVRYDPTRVMDTHPDWFSKLFYEASAHSQTTLRSYLGAEDEGCRKKILEHT